LPRTYEEFRRGIAARDQVALAAWFRQSGRRYPWRDTLDPFRVLCAEFMLRRTRADQVAPIYERFLKRFPSPGSVAYAERAEVEEALRGLGLDWRVRQFVDLCTALVDRFDGQVPESFAELTALPGVGEYSAAAIRIFAFDVEGAPVDANVMRVFSRYFGVGLRDADRRQRQLFAALEAARIHGDHKKFWWAILDIGATVCVGRKPRHSMCPLRHGCAAVSGDEAAGVPAKIADGPKQYQW